MRKRQAASFKTFFAKELNRRRDPGVF